MGFPPAVQSTKQGLLLAGHGTRNSRGLAEFWAVARQVAKLAGEFAVEACFLELAEPTIPAAVQRLLQQGVERLTVAPLLLFAAGHAKRDIPEAVEEAIRAQGAGRRPQGAGVAANYLGALECHPRILELSSQRYAEALQGQPPVPAAETLLILVGRGSSHADAIAAMQKFAALRQRQTAVDRVEVCFAAVAKPTLNEALDAAASSSYRRIVVQPHLLFVGEVLEQIEEAVREQEEGVSGRWSVVSGQAVARPEKQWMVAPHLGPSNLVAQAVVEMARAGNN